ncbi:Mss4-like protein [Hypoxylon rubiginosum]|uniref:Mss4-like protein n=1 Tax=Hypoxylon rubiginosum TaxID=110542 RepID=A0ACC0D1Z6_9PEZI|nr:Mss4-like protein [Hypoxylon rubiginosum]
MSWNSHPAYAGGGPSDGASASQAREPVEPEQLGLECLCGKVFGVINGIIGPHRVCHCNVCKKVTGGTHANILIVDRDHLMIDQNLMVKFSWYDPDEFNTMTDIFRCGQCGSPIYKCHEYYPDIIKVFVGCLKHMSYLESNQPDKELKTHARLAWLPSLVKPPTPPSTSSLSSLDSNMELVESEPDMEIVVRVSSSSEEDKDTSSDDREWP